MTTSQSTGSSGATPRRGWFGRNWKWFLPVSGILVIVVAVVLSGLIEFWPAIRLRNSEPYQTALKEVCGNAKIQEALGSPIEATRLLPGGELVENQAYLQFDVRGSKASAAVEGKARIFDGKWVLQRLVVKIDGGPQIDITPQLSVNETATPSKLPDKTPPAAEQNFPQVNIDVPPLGDPPK